MNHPHLKALALNARPLNEADWGSERQIEAENLFFKEVEALVTTEDFAALEEYSLHATTNERIDYALSLIAKAGG